MPRKYTKKNSEYWNNKRKAMSSSGSKLKELTEESQDFEPQSFGEPLISFESNASRLDGTTRQTKARTNRSATEPLRKRFQNIEDGLLPFEYSKDFVGVKEAIVLTQKAYFNIPTVKSTIDLLEEFTSTEIYLDGGNASSREFTNKWLKLIGIHDLTEQSFREYYRSGNVFPYALEGNLTASTIKNFSLSNAKNSIPIKYVILNPSDVVVRGQLDFGSYSYAKVLTPFEITRLKKSDSEESRKIYESLPKDVKEKISSYNENSYSANKEILLPLESNLIHPIFYKKQDYEPMAVPMCFSVLDDINKKIELKKVDQAISRSIENVILLVTMGAEKDKGGINYKNISAMQSLFENKSVGRVIVSDYTTKADFLIPDIKKVMGKEKYEVLNKDIEEGLANILLGESKYSDTELKLKIFFERLAKARERFLRDFLQPEINRVCKQVGFRSFPKAKFVKKDTITSADLQKLATRMMELSILTPEQGMDLLNKGAFPEKADMSKEQEKYVKEREKGHYLPMVQSSALFETENTEVGTDELSKKEGGSDTKPQGHRQKNTVSSPTGGRPTGTASKYSFKAIREVTDKLKDLASKGEAVYKKRVKLKKLTEDQKEVVTDICSAVAVASEMEEWEKKLEEVIENSNLLLSLSVNKEVLNIAAEHNLDDYAASLLYHSTKIKDA